MTGDVDEAYLKRIDQARNDLTKSQQGKVNAIIDLHNN